MNISQSLPEQPIRIWPDRVHCVMLVQVPLLKLPDLLHTTQLLVQYAQFLQLVATSGTDSYRVCNIPSSLCVLLFLWYGECLLKLV